MNSHICEACNEPCQVETFTRFSGSRTQPEDTVGTSDCCQAELCCELSEPCTKHQMLIEA